MSKAEEPSLSEITRQIDQCMLKDRYLIMRTIRKINQRRQLQKPIDHLLQKVGQQFKRSCAQRERRGSLIPEVQYPSSLPVSDKREEISQLIKANQVVIVCGETGSGKTTQLPKICLELGYGINGMIGHTQPRRIAARAVSSRIAEELSCEPGQQVGYKVRFDDVTSENTLIKLMTDGMLLTETQSDRYLNQYEVIIIDEAHERSLNIDFLIGYLKHIQSRRPDLKIIVTSATLDPERFSRHFSMAPVIEVSGRTYPVDIKYCPMTAQDEEQDVVSAVVATVEEISRIDHGDILVFFAAEREIREAAEALNKRSFRLTEVLPLYGRLSAGEQNRIFRPGSKRHIVLATNIAETSLTVPRIRYVIDTGRARISRYSHRLKIQQLPIEAVSQASANQRSGRCGRVSAGVCYRLYSEDDYLSRPVYTQPEILRTNLASVILQMHALDLGSIESFPFIEPPDRRYISDGIRQLRELGAMDSSERLTTLGKRLAGLPIDPRVGRMLFAAETLGCLRELLVIASALEVQDVRERPLDRQQQADQAHALYRDADSDFSGLLTLWRYVNEQREALSSNQFRKLCKSQFLSWMRLREWRDTHQQLSRIVKEMGMRPNHQPAGYDAIHQALLSGLLSHIGHKDEDRTYQGARNTCFRIFPGSGVARKSPDWVVAAEIVETSQVFARSVARIEPRWIEQAAQHLVQRQYTEPHWYARKGYVSARESVSLYGLILVSNRRVNYGTVNPEHARSIFIEQALVGREYDSKAAFWKHNGSLLDDIESLEHRQRRRDVLVDDDVIYRFYDELIPEGIHNRHSFEKWRKKAEQQNPELLYMTRDLLMRHDAIGVSRERYPDHLTIRGNHFPLQYHFNPGHEVDGVSVDVPAILLAGLEQSDFDWLVPGLLFEKIVALIKSLPKTIRKQFVPAPDFAQACVEVIEYGKGSLVGQLTRQLKRMTGYDLQSTDFQPEQLPEHLHFNFNVIDASGHVLAVGRNLVTLQHQLHERNVPGETLESPEHEWTRDGIVCWNFGSLPEVIEVRHGKQQLNMYPAIWDCGDSVSLELCTSETEAGQHTHWGVLRLAYLTLSDQRKSLFRRFRELQQHLLEYSLLPENEWLTPPPVLSLMDDWMEHCIYLSFQLAAPKDIHPTDSSGFDDFLDHMRGRLVETGEQLLQSIQQTMLRWQQLRTLLGDIQRHETIYHDVQQQLDWLLYQGFVHDIHNDWIFEYPRFMQALIVRLERYRNDPSRDERLMLQVKPYQEGYVQTMTEWLAEGYDSSELDEVRWALENYRVSLFAQELKTRQPVSAKRMKALFAEFSIPVKDNT